MHLTPITTQLARQAQAIRNLVEGITDAQARWQPSATDWSILEVIHHLYDEESEDFRCHVDHLLHHAGAPWPEIDPQAWVTERQYNQQDPAAVLANFLAARQESLAWLHSLPAPVWESSMPMPWGALSAGDVLVSWAAHDLLHLRQLIELHYAYTERQAAPFSVRYAGAWTRDEGR